MITNREMQVLDYLRGCIGWRNSAQITTDINLNAAQDDEFISHHDMKDILESMMGKKLIEFGVDKSDGMTYVFRYPQTGQSNNDNSRATTAI